MEYIILTTSPSYLFDFSRIIAIILFRNTENTAFQPFLSPCYETTVPPSLLERRRRKKFEEKRFGAAQPSHGAVYFLIKPTGEIQTRVLHAPLMENDTSE